MEELPFFPPAIMRPIEGGGNFALIVQEDNGVCSSLVVVPVTLAVLVMSLVTWSDVLGAWWLLPLTGIQNNTLQRRTGPLYKQPLPGTAMFRGPTFTLKEDNSCPKPVMTPMAVAVLTINFVNSAQLMGTWLYILVHNPEANLQLMRTENQPHSVCHLRFSHSEGSRKSVEVPATIGFVIINFLAASQLLGAWWYMEHIQKDLVRTDGLEENNLNLYPGGFSMFQEDEGQQISAVKVHVALGLLSICLIAFSLLWDRSKREPDTPEQGEGMREQLAGQKVKQREEGPHRGRGANGTWARAQLLRATLTGPRPGP